MEKVVAPNINVVKRGIIFGSTTKLGNKLGGVSKVRNLSQSLALPTNGVYYKVVLSFLHHWPYCHAVAFLTHEVS
jgi:hypothetical protein